MTTSSINQSSRSTPVTASSKGKAAAQTSETQGTSRGVGNGKSLSIDRPNSGSTAPLTRSWKRPTVEALSARAKQSLGQNIPASFMNEFADLAATVDRFLAQNTPSKASSTRNDPDRLNPMLADKVIAGKNNSDAFDPNVPRKTKGNPNPASTQEGLAESQDPTSQALRGLNLQGLISGKNDHGQSNPAAPKSTAQQQSLSTTNPVLKNNDQDDSNQGGSSQGNTDQGGSGANDQDGSQDPNSQNQSNDQTGGFMAQILEMVQDIYPTILKSNIQAFANSLVAAQTSAMDSKRVARSQAKQQLNQTKSQMVSSCMQIPAGIPGIGPGIAGAAGGLNAGVQTFAGTGYDHRARTNTRRGGRFTADKTMQDTFAQNDNTIASKLQDTFKSLSDVMSTLTSMWTSVGQKFA